MKTVGFLISLLSLSAFAAVNPQIRICNLTQGQYLELKSSDDHISYCQYGDHSLIDSLSVINSSMDNRKTLAVRALLESGITACEQVDALAIQAQGLFEEVTYTVCLFRDHSVLELETLKAGANSAKNEKLMKALNSRF